MPRSRLALAFIITMLWIFLLAVGESMFVRPTLGQVAPIAPAVPGQPLPLATIGALPALAPAPGTQLVAAPTAAATPREFRCTCSGPGFPTSWSGMVAASSYILARQQASGSCTAYNVNAHAESPYIRPPGTTASQPPGTFFSAPPGQVGVSQVTIPGNEPVALSEKVEVAAECQRCACN